MHSTVTKMLMGRLVSVIKLIITRQSIVINHLKTRKHESNIKQDTDRNKNLYPVDQF